MAMTVGDILSQRPRPLGSGVRWLELPDTGELVPQTLASEVRGPLQKAFDFLNIGIYPLANVADAILRGDSNLAQAAWRGLTMQERKTFVDVLKAHNVPAAELIGFVLDVGLDVNTYINFGVPLLAKVAKAVRGAKWFEEATNVLRQNSVVDFLGQAFSTTWRLPKTYVDSRTIRRYWFTDQQRRVLEEVEDWARKIPLKRRRLMAYVMENPELVERLTEEEQRIVLTYTQQFMNYLERAVQEKLIPEETARVMAGKYVPHVFAARLPHMTVVPEGPMLRPFFARQRTFRTLQEVHAYRADYMRLVRATAPDSKAAPDAIAEIAKRIKERWGDPIDRWISVHKTREQLHEWAKEVVRHHTPLDDLAQLVAIYKNAWVQYEARKSFLNDVLNRFGAKTTFDMVPAPGHKVFLPRGSLAFFEEEVAKTKWPTSAVEEFLKAAKAAFDEGEELVEVPESVRRMLVGVTRNVEAWHLPEAIARDLSKSIRFIGGSPEAKAFLRLMDRFLGPWKSLATAWRLPFHMRNMYSNAYMMWLGGVPVHEIPRLFLDAAKVLLAATPAGAARFGNQVIGKTGMTAQKLADRLQRVGVMHSGFFTADFERAVLDLSKLAQGKSTREILQRIWEAPRQFGRAIENLARVGLTIHRLEQGDKLIDAARHTWKYLFDYEDITPFEREFLRRLIPFYTWMRKSIPLHLHVLATNPRKFAQVSKAFHALEEVTDLRDEDWRRMPEWVRQFGWFRLPWKDERGQELWAFIDIPMQDLVRFGRVVTGQDFFMSEIVPMLNPIITAAMQIAGLRTFPFMQWGRERIERFPGDLEPAPWFVGLFPPALLEAIGAGPMIERKTGRMVLGWPKTWAATFYTMVPGARELANMFPGGAVDVEPEDAPWRIVSYLTGVQVKPFDRAEEEMWRAIERRNKLQMAIKRQMLTGKPLTAEELRRILEQ